ncbi:MAG TPA: VOC family protein [Phycisphaerae bacterium]|nr:VOC family protein [Phycisphaerae bacterium]
MFALDHVAIQTNDIAGTAKFYAEEFGAQILYQDESWAFLRLGQGKLALVNPKQRPAHVAMRATLEQLEQAAEHFGKTIKTHRDGTKGIYVEDPSGNQVELIYYPPEYKTL